MKPASPFPGTVTAVVLQQRARPGLGKRVNVFIDGRFSFALDAALAIDRGLRPGLEIDAALLDMLIREDGDSRALGAALCFMARRLRSRAEVEARLRRDEWPAAIVERTVARLIASGQLCDEVYAAALVRTRSAVRPRGARALTDELRRKGIDRATIDGALPGGGEELANAIAAVRRKWESLAGVEERERKEKSLAFLQRRGFSFATARQALARLHEE